MNKQIYVIGDIHGAHKALIQCLERSNFNKEEDILIQLGDIADGWNEVYQCVEELLSIKNLITIKGNHDDWFMEFLVSGMHPCGWQQGGIGTLRSYCEYLDKNFINRYSGGYTTDLLPEDIPIEHINLFKQQSYYYIDESNNCFVHGGFNRHHTMEDNRAYYPEQFWWDRDLWSSALSHKGLTDTGNYDGKFKNKDNFTNIFIGHTTTMNWGTDKPMIAANIINLDTGAGFKGKLTIMNVETKDYYQSDPVQDLYPNQKGRN